MSNNCDNADDVGVPGTSERTIIVASAERCATAARGVGVIEGTSPVVAVIRSIDSMAKR